MDALGFMDITPATGYGTLRYDLQREQELSGYPFVTDGVRFVFVC